MEQVSAPNILDDRRIKLLNFLLKNHNIPEYGNFNLKELIAKIPKDEYEKLFENNPEFEAIWENIDMPSSLTNFLVERDLAQRNGDDIHLTQDRGRDLQKQGSYDKLLEGERHITSEAHRVSELEQEAHKLFKRQYKINVIIAMGTAMAAIYYLLEILNGFFGFYQYPR